MKSIQLRLGNIVGLATNPAICNRPAGKPDPSFDLVFRIMALYPTLNGNWLLMGSGESNKGSIAQSGNIMTLRKANGTNEAKMEINPD
jgi:hypothetical protein